MPICSTCGFESSSSTCPVCEAAVEPEVSEDSPTALKDSEPDRGRTIETGTDYAERYRIEATLGKGGMGRVYRVVDRESGETRALKVIYPEVVRRHRGAERMKREFEMLSRIRHPAVIRLYAWGARGSEVYLVTEFVDGRTLRDCLRDQGPWPAEEAAALGAIVADALAAAHSNRVVHRDVKPHNIMIDKQGDVKLLDFGIARAIGLELNEITASGVSLGTPEYMAPEQFGARRIDGRCDIYSLGVVLFQLVTGRLPFEGETIFEIASMHENEPAPSMRSIRPEVPAWLDRIVLRCLEKAPADRYLTATELAADLRQPRNTARPRRRRLTTGDICVEDRSGLTDWPLALESETPKTGWMPGMVLKFGDAFYQLSEVVAGAGEGRTAYRFTVLPESSVIRGFVDYDEDSRARREGMPITGRIRKWIKGK